MNESTFYLGEKYSVQWWVRALLRLRRTAREANYLTLRWESNLELEFSKYFGIEGSVSSAKKLAKVLEIVRLWEATPEEREKRCRENKDAARRWKEVQKWHSKFSGTLPDGRDIWDHFYITALAHLENALRSARDDRDPEESSVRDLAMRLRVWMDLYEKFKSKAFEELMLNPGRPSDRMEMMIQKEITKLRDKPSLQPVWSRLSRRYRAQAHDS